MYMRVCDAKPKFKPQPPSEHPPMLAPLCPYKVVQHHLAHQGDHHHLQNKPLKTSPDICHLLSRPTSLGGIGGSNNVQTLANF